MSDDLTPITHTEALAYLHGLLDYVHAIENDPDGTYVLPDDAATMLADLIAREQRNAPSAADAEALRD